MKRRLLAVQGPLQFLTGYIALSWLKQQQGDAGHTEDVLLLYDFLCDESVEASIADAILALSRIQPWSKIVFLRKAEMAKLATGHQASRIAQLRSRLGGLEYDDILLARDHVGEGSPLLMNTFARARKVTYGDSFGIVGQRQVFERLDRQSGPRRFLSAVKQKALGVARGRLKEIPFDLAVLSLPIDMSGQFQRATPLSVPSRDHVCKSVERLSRLVDGLDDYSRRALSRDGAVPSHVFLLSNLTASSLTSLEGEANLYNEIIERTSAPGSSIVIKRHPRSDRQVLDAVAKHASKQHAVTVLDDTSYDGTPIELWRDLIEHCAIVPIFSTSAINLKYLYGKQCQLPMTPELIERHFLPDKVGYARSIYGLISEVMNRLDTWDQDSMLWEGGA